MILSFLSSFLYIFISLQITNFKCGGIAFGLSWAHVLGDAFSAIDCINRWGQIMALDQPNSSLPNKKLENFENPSGIAIEFPLSLKRVDPVGDHWIPPSDSKMQMFSFTITPTQITHLQMKVMGPLFESLCAIIWKSIAKIRQDGSEPKTITICKNDHHKRKSGKLSNSLIISTVKADHISVVDADPNKLASLLVDQAVDETAQIEEVVEKDQGVSDFIVYGANLTFLDFQEADLYGLELQGRKPQFASYAIQGVGDKGAVLVLPGPKDSGKNGGDGKLVTLILPEGEILELQSELRKNDLLLENTIE